MIFHNQGHPEKKLDCKLKKQEIVFDTAVFTYELTFDNTDYTDFLKAIESRYSFFLSPDFEVGMYKTNVHFCRKDTSMPVRANIFFDMFPFCILFEVCT